MVIYIPIAHSLPPHTVANRDYPPRMPPSRKRYFQITTDTEPNPKKRRVQGKRKGQRRASRPTPVITPLKNTLGMDVLVPPDVKPDVKPLGDDNMEESFATRIAKGSRRILINEYPELRPPGNIKSNSATSVTSPPDLETIPLWDQANKNVNEPNIITVATANDITDTPNCNEKSLVPTGIIRVVDDKEIEHRKQKHKVGI